MPAVYEYRCPHCELTIEDISPAARIQCDCEGLQSPYFNRVYSIGGIQFKGKGFYKTDK